MSKELDEALRFDPLLEAEKVTGLSYKEDDATQGLGFLFLQANSKRKRELLSANGDTHWSMDFDAGMAVFESLGFEVVLSDEFQSRVYGDETPITETFNVLWHDAGILAVANTYRGKSMDGAKIYYNVVPDASLFRFDYERDDEGRPTDYETIVEVPAWERGHFTADKDSFSRHTSSGGYYDYDGQRVWVGDHDAREGLVHSIESLRSVGEFLPVWRDRPFLWLLTPEDTRDGAKYDYEAINAERISRLPQHVQDAIKGDDVKVPIV